MMRFFNKSVTLSASLVIAFSTGLTYLFGLWSETLKEAYGLSQEQVEAIGSACNLGGCGGILSGLFLDRLRAWPGLGPRATVVIGLTIHGVGYTLLWAAVTRRFVASYWQLLALAAVACNGGTWLDTAALATNVRNYPSHRGSVVGALKSGVGLSASLYATVYAAAFQGSPASFLLFLALAPVAAGLLAVPFVNAVPQRRPTAVSQRRDEARFAWAIAAIALLAAYLAATSVLGSLRSLSARARVGVAAGAAALLLPLLLIPLKRPFTTTESPTEQQGARGGLTSPLLPGGSSSPGHGSRTGPAQPGDDTPLPDLPLGQMLRSSPDFWLLFAGCAVGTGAALTFLNNLGQMVLALGGPPGGSTVFLSLFSVASAGGRLVLGQWPERRLHAVGTPRPLFLVGVSLLTAAVCLGVSLGRLPLLYPLSVLAGLAFGGHWVLMASIISEVGGLRSFASTYTALQLAPALGSYSLSSKLAGWLYDREAARQAEIGLFGEFKLFGHPSVCLGPLCYRWTFLLLSALSMAAAACNGVLYLRTRGLYRRLYLQAQAVSRREEEG